VIVARGGGGFDVADVRVGTEVDGKTTILSGLKEGQSIVISGQFLIDSEASLKSSMSRLEAAAPTSAADTADRRGTTKRASHRTRGRIVSITADQITIAHEPVPSLNWPAMTMAFQLPQQGIPSGLEESERVAFSFSANPGGGYQIERITPLAGEEPRQ
jgi:membrane fusion protein, copper/silver efflux system